MSARPNLSEGPMFCTGPFRALEGSRWIVGVDAWGDICHVADIRGWGYLTGAGRALALSLDEALAAQVRAVNFIVDAMNEKLARDAALSGELITREAADAERDAADRRAAAIMARVAAVEADAEAARKAAADNHAKRATAEAAHLALASDNDRVTAKVAELEACLERQSSGHREDLDEIANVSVERLRRAEAADAENAALRARLAVVEGARDDWDDLVADARAEAAKAMRKFPQPNYVISKIAEEAGEVVKAAIHCAEGRETMVNLRGEMKQTLAMLYRLWIEGDQVHGLPPVCAALQATTKEPTDE